MSNVKSLNVKPDRLANQIALLEQANEELWQLVEKYQELGLIDPLIRGMFHDVAFELQMGRWRSLKMGSRHDRLPSQGRTR